jgi:hypothetical protein
MLPREIRETLDEGDIHEIWEYVPKTDLDIGRKGTTRQGLRYVLGFVVYPPPNLTAPLLRRCMQGVFFWWMDTRDQEMKQAVTEMLFGDIKLEKEES